MKRKLLALVIAVAVMITFVPVIPGVVDDANAADCIVDLPAVTSASAGDSLWNTTQITIGGISGEISSQKWSDSTGEVTGTFAAGTKYSYDIDITINGASEIVIDNLKMKAGGINWEIDYANCRKSPRDENVIYLRILVEVSEALVLPDPGYPASGTTVSDLQDWSSSYGGTLKPGEAWLKWDWDNSADCDGFYVYANREIVYTAKKSVDFQSYTSNVSVIKYLGMGTVKVFVVPFCTAGGTIYKGKPSNTITVTTATVDSPCLAISKIASGKVRITWNKPADADGVKIYAGSKYIASSTKAKGHYTYSRKGAAKLDYYSRAYVNGFTADAKGPYQAKANKWYHKFTPSGAYYNDYKYHVNLNSLYYTKSNSKGKLKAKIAITNAHALFYLKKSKIQITVKSQGKTVASQTFSLITKVDPGKCKVFTVTFKKAKTCYDISNAGIDSYKLKYISYKHK